MTTFDSNLNFNEDLAFECMSSLPIDVNGKLIVYKRHEEPPNTQQ